MNGGTFSQQPSLLSKFKALDAFPKQRDEAQEFFHKTTSGAVITLVAGSIMFLLFCSELRLFLRVSTANELSVDTSRGEQLDIHFDLTFPHVPCSWVSIDAMDVSGDTHLDVQDHDVYMKRLSADGHPIDEGIKKQTFGPTAPKKTAKEINGTECGSCYGAETLGDQCCNTCQEVREAYRKRGWALLDMDKIEQCHKEGYKDELEAQRGEGCHMWGQLLINKVAGNFHIAPGKSYQQGNMHVHDLSPFAGHTFDFSHTIHKLSFGQEYPGMRNPLDGVSMQQREGSNSGSYQYFLKVVPTSYTDLSNRTIATNQFSVTEHFREQQPGAGGQQLPGLFFFYDLSPIKVRFQEERPAFLSFVTSACAIVGGVFTVSGIVDGFIYQGQRLVKKKMDLGKYS